MYRKKCKFYRKKCANKKDSKCLCGPNTLRNLHNGITFIFSPSPSLAIKGLAGSTGADGEMKQNKYIL